MRTSDLVGYQFSAATYCGAHVVTAMAERSADVAALRLEDSQDVGTEQRLEIIADGLGINRGDERSFDSDDFPKVLLRDSCTPSDEAGELGDSEYAERCDHCGVVLADEPGIPWQEAANERAYLDSFLQGYMECALWASSDDQENPLDDKYCVADINAALKRDMRRECARFIRANRDDLDRLRALTGRSDGSMGHDLWLSRNGHGTGYWDRYMEAGSQDRDEAKRVGERLSSAAEQLGEFSIAPEGEHIGAM